MQRARREAILTKLAYYHYYGPSRLEHSLSNLGHSLRHAANAREVQKLRRITIGAGAVGLAGLAAATYALTRNNGK